MSKSAVLGIRVASNVHQLLGVLHELTSGTGIHHTKVNVFGNKGGGLRVRLIEDTLTDGSKVLNINIE